MTKPSETQFVAQEAADEGSGEARRAASPASRPETLIWAIIMLSTLLRKTAEDGQFVLFHRLARALDHRKLVMRVERRGGIAGKMFAAAENPCRAQAAVKGAGLRDDLCRRAAVTAAAQGIFGFVVEGNVQHRAEIEIEAEQPEQPSGDVAMPANESEVALIAELLSVRRFIANKLQARNPAAFLIDRDDGFDPT